MPEPENRILVVDDDDAIRSLLLTILRRRGLKVDAARNSAEALERCAQCRYGVVLLDLITIDGYEFLDAVRTLPVEERPVVLVLTDGGASRAIDPELVSAVLRKPFDVALISETVAACVRACGGYSQREECPSAELN